MFNIYCYYILFIISIINTYFAGYFITLPELILILSKVIFNYKTQIGHFL